MNAAPPVVWNVGIRTSILLTLVVAACSNKPGASPDPDASAWASDHGIAHFVL